jgi:hypothetical protein
MKEKCNASDGACAEKGLEDDDGRQDLGVGLGLGQVHHAAAIFPQAALFEQVNALETFEDVALGCDGAGGTKAAVLGHKGLFGLKGNGQ